MSRILISLCEKVVTQLKKSMAQMCLISNGDFIATKKVRWDSRASSSLSDFRHSYIVG